MDNYLLLRSDSSLIELSLFSELTGVSVSDILRKSVVVGQTEYELIVEYTGVLTTDSTLLADAERQDDYEVEAILGLHDALPF